MMQPGLGLNQRPPLSDYHLAVFCQLNHRALIGGSAKQQA